MNKVPEHYGGPPVKRTRPGFESLLERRGVTRTAVAEAMGVTTQTLRNKLKDPGSFLVRDLGAMSGVLGVDVPVLLKILDRQA